MWVKPPPPPKYAVLPPEEPIFRQTTFGTAGMRKKGVSVRSWLLVDANGLAQVVEVGKHAIMRRTGLPGRDLRMLDPLLSYPSTVLGRERAIVVNLEHIKAIITAQEVMFVNSSDPLMSPFVKKLQGILRHRKAFKSAKEATVDGDSVDMGILPNLEEPHSTAVSRNPSEGFSDKNEEGNADGGQDPETGQELKLLPIEFVALEACLEAACSCLDNEARTLEQEAHPALDKLTSKISTLNLERVRQIKSRLVAITGRVQKVRDELEQLLDDDEDMAEMYLTYKFEQQQLENASASPVNELNGIVTEEDPSNVENRTPGDIAAECDGNSVVSDTHIQETDHQPENSPFEPYTLRSESHRSPVSTHSGNNTKRVDVEELEMILEAYFVQIEGTLNKLSNLREYVDDTEDYINIMLDDKQNSLLQMGVMLTTATVVVSAFVALTGVFGMNIHIELFDDDKAGMPEFLWTVGGGTAGCVFLYAVAIAWCKHKRLLE